MLGAQPDSAAVAVVADFGAMTVGTAERQAGEAAEDASAESRDWAARPVAVGSGSRLITCDGSRRRAAEDADRRSQKECTRRR